MLEGEGGLCGADGNGFFQVSSVSGDDVCVSGWGVAELSVEMRRERQKEGGADVKEGRKGIV